MRTFVVASLLLVANPGWAPAESADQPLSEVRFRRLQQRLREKLETLKAAAAFPGLSVGFVLPDGRSAGAAVGLADVENKVPLKPSDRMLAGSIGKTFVAAVLLQLVEEGKVKLDDRLLARLANEPWAARLPNANDLTLRCLLTHTSGLPEYFEVPAFLTALKADPGRERTPAELLAFVLDAKPLFPVGKGWAYADTNYLLLGLVVEKATGKPLFDEITRRLLRPLNLKRTLPSDRPSLPEVAVGYSMPRSPFGVEGRMIVGGKFRINPQFEGAGGGLASTPEDLACWARALYEGKAFRDRATLEAMLTGVDSSSGRGGGKGRKYGLGVQIRDSEWGPCYGHGGWFPGYLSEMAYFPKLRVAVAVQFNTDQGQALKKGLSAYLEEVLKVVLAGTD